MPLGAETYNQHRPHNSQDYLTPSEKVGSKIRETTIAQEFAAIRDEVGISGSNPPTFHEIRSLSTRLYKEKYGEEFAQALLGHKSDKMAALYQDERDGWFRPKIAK